MTRKRSQKATRLVAALEGHERVVILLHDHPDPDAVASGWAVRRLLRRWAGKTARLVAGGRVIRPDNRQMMATLQPPLELLDRLPADDPCAVVLVDCAAMANNHLALPQSARAVAVIDHHPPRSGERYSFRDIRPNVAACASMVTGYLEESGIEPDPVLATALLHAIRTETRTVEAVLSRVDRAALRWLTLFADQGAIARIETAPLPRGYFADLAAALRETVVVGDSALCVMPAVQGADTLGELADLLIRDVAVAFVLVAAPVGEDVLVSVRTDIGGPDAGSLVRRALAGLGDGGGHERRAGGRIEGGASGKRIPDRLRERLAKQWVAACGQHTGGAEPFLVA